MNPSDPIWCIAFRTMLEEALPGSDAERYNFLIGWVFAWCADQDITEAEILAVYRHAVARAKARKGEIPDEN